MAEFNPSSNGNFRVIGTRPVRHDGLEKVTGQALYGADYSMPGMLHGKVLRSPHAHAVVKSINIDRALKHPGVHAAITGADFPEVKGVMAQVGELVVNTHYLSLNVMARDKVLYDGHPVAAVAAISKHVAEEALDLIEVEYEVLPPVMTAEQAMKPDAPILLPELRSKLIAHRTDPGSPEGPDRPTNIASHIQFQRGDLKAGFKSADFIVEREYTTATVHQGYIEPQNALAAYSADGHVTIYCSTQGSFNVRTLTASMLGISEGMIRVVPAEIGGGFGGKTTIYLEPLAVLLSQKSGRPVKLTMTRGEVLRATGPTSGTRMRVKMGATRDGKITAAEVWMAYEAGAFPGSPFAPGAMTTLGPYNVENLKIDSFDVVVNRPKVAAYRAPGSPASAFACETAIDELAEKCGIDPLELRLRNASQEGTPQPAGPPFKKIGYIETVEAIRTSDHYRSELTGKHRGRGVASGFWFNGGLQSSATVNVHNDGSVSVVTGSVDIGGSRAAMAMVAAEVLGLDAGDVRPIVTDTDASGHTDVTGGSRIALATGLAVYDAANDAVRQLKERVARLWEKRPGEIEFENGVFKAAGDGTAPMSLKQLATRLARTGGPVTGRATVNAGAVGAVGNAFATVCVDVEVDPDTGKVQILRATLAQDVGRAIHPSYVEGQMQGGLAQGIGWALNEEYVYDERGILRNAGFLDYRMPTCLDLPLLETIMVEVPNPSHPLGVRGVGEVSIVPPMAAVANAIYRAVGVRMTELPISPPRLLRAWARKRGDSLESQAAAAD
ncbi:MAG: xanthine dehydrogenase family protein molybdopterin-binding subunit [Deltaproteobacteria bacterium]|nr:xanthine dehydrogenase family protein molybdopterin-binding subunit [Deltaproteobacteria bacterium]